MEESEKRKERLRAMRMKAAQVDVCSNVESVVMPNPLSNPLVENSATQPVEDESHATPRFDFYTDPVSAFSVNKKRGQPDNLIRQDYFTPPSHSGSAMARPSSSIPEPRNFEMAPSPAHQLQNSFPFDRRMYQTQGHYNNAVAYGGPRGSPLPMHQGTFQAWNRPQATTGHYRSEWNRSPATHGYRNPRGMVNPFPNIHEGTSKSWNNGSGGVVENNSTGGDPFFSPGFRPVRSPSFSHGQGRPHWQGSSLSPGSGHGVRPGTSSGRGKDQWYGGSMSPGLGRSGGTGRRVHSRGLGAKGRNGPECFYHRSMDENPWQQLEPRVWKSRSLKSPDSSNLWLPKSINTKKVRVSETFKRSSSQLSLAEYLAAAFNEAASDTPNS